MIKIQILISLAILLTSFPAGYLLAYLARDELVSGRKYFLALACISLIASFIIAFFSFAGKIPAILALFYIAIVSFVSAWKSYDKKFVK